MACGPRAAPDWLLELVAERLPVGGTLGATRAPRRKTLAGASQGAPPRAEAGPRLAFRACARRPRALLEGWVQHVAEAAARSGKADLQRRALRVLALRHAQQACGPALCAGLLHPRQSRLVRLEALQVFPVLRGDEDAVAQCLAVARSSLHDADARDLALQGLEHVAERGHACAKHVLALAEQRTWPGVRLAALRALARLAPPGDEPVLAAAAKALTETLDPLKRGNAAPRALATIALDTLASVAPVGHHAAREAAEAALAAGAPPETRAAAVACLGRLGAAAAVLAASLEDPHADARLAAARALGARCGRDADARVVCAERLAHARSDVREAAVGALGLGGPSAVQLLLGMCGDASVSVRGAAVAALAHAAAPGDARAAAALQPLREDPDPHVRAAAAAACDLLARGAELGEAP